MQIESRIFGSIEIDDDKQTIVMDIPDGLLELNTSGSCVEDDDD